MGDSADNFRLGGLRRGAMVGGSAVALVALAAGWLGLPLSAASASPLLYLSEPFSGAQVQIPSDWVLPALPSGTTGTNVACLTASGSTAQTPIPGCSASPTDLPGNGTLRLTAATGNVDGGVSYATAVPSSQGLDVTFDTYQYGGTGADGILLYLAGTNPMQPAPPASLGPPGGHLGYSGGTAAPTGPGIADGYLGVGLDVYGNYSNNAFDGSGCTDPSWVGKGARVTNQVTVRGPGSGTQGYCPLASSAGAGGLQGKLDGGTTGTRSTSLVPTEIAINPTAATVSARGIANVPAYSYAVAVSPLGGPTQYVIGSLPNASAYEPSSWLEPSTGIPYQLAFGFAASTGGSNDVHEVRNVQIQPLFTNPARAVLQISDSAAGHLVAGTPVTYSITPSISALGGSENQPMSFTDTFPAGVVPGGGSGTNWSCSTVGQTVTCDYTGGLPIASGTTLPSITVPAAVANGATGTLDDVGQLVSDDSQIVSATDPGTVGVALVTPVLGVSLADGAGGAYVQGGAITYTAKATVSSGGGAETAAPRLVDVFPAGVTPGAASGTNWSCATVAQTVTCNYTGGLPIAAGTTLPTASLPVTVGTSASGGVSDTITLSSTDATPSSVSASVSGSILSVPQYSLTLTDSRGGNFVLGAAVTYTATPTLVAGSGSESAAPTYSQTLATGVTPTAVSGTNWTCTKSGQSVNCTYSGAFPISPGTQLQPITVSANVSAGATGNLSSSGTVQSSDGLSATTVDSANAGSPPPPSLGVTASAPSQTYAGRNYTLTIGPAITTGSAPADHDPVVKSILPAGETFTAAPTPAGYSCALSTTTVASDTLTCTSTAATPIAAGTLGTIGATVAVAPATTPGSLSTTTTLSDPADGATPASNGTTITCVANPVPAVTTSGPPNAVAGSPGTIVVTPSLSGAGGPAFTDPVVTVTAPSGGTIASAPTPAGWSCVLSGANTILTCTSTAATPIGAGTALGAISASVTFSATPGTQTTSATLSDTPDSATPATSSATTTTTAIPQLAVTVSSPAQAVAGSIGTVVITPSTTGAGGPAYTDPVVTVTAPSGGMFPSAPAPTGWTCVLSGANTILTCTSTAATPIAAGTPLGAISASVTFSATPGTQTASATLSDSPDLATPATNSATTTTTAIPQLAVTVSSPAQAVAGSIGTIVVTPSITGTGGPAYVDPVVIVTAPSGGTFPSAPTPAGWSCVLSGANTVLTCASTASTPVAAGTALGVISASVTFSSTPGAQTTSATLSDIPDLATPATNSATTTTTAIPQLAVTVSSPAQAVAGSIGTIVVTPSITGAGGPAYVDPVVTVTAPSGGTFTSAPTPAGWSCVLSGANTVLTCTSTTATPIGASTGLGAINASVTFSSTPGAQTTSATLSDSPDLAIPATNSATTTTTAAPVLAVTASGPATAVAGSIGTVVITPSISGAGGPAFTDPVVTVAAPSGGTFPSAPTPAGWSCAVSGANTVLTCTSTAATPIPSSTALGAISASVTFSSTPGAQTTSATLSDAPDSATPATNSATTTTTAIPQLAITVSSPASAVAGSIGTVVVTPSITGAGGPTYVDPVVNVTAAGGGTFASTPTPVGWSCVLSGASTVLTCTSTAAVPIPSGTALGAISASVTFSPTPGTQTTSATLSDTPDGATPATKSATTTTTAGPPVLAVTVSSPAHAVAGSIGTAVVTPSISGTGGPAQGDPVVTVTAPSGGTFASAPSPAGWSCALSAANTVLTCTSTAVTPIPSGTALGAINAGVTFSSTPGAQTTSATLSDTADTATPVTKAATTTTTAAPVLVVTTSGSAHGVVGSTKSIVVTPSITGAGGPAYADPVVTVTAPSGGTFPSAPTPAGWSCALSAANTVLTCTSTTATPVVASTALGVISPSVTFSSTPGAQTTSATVSDTADSATPATDSVTTTTTAAPVLAVTTSGPTSGVAGSIGTVVVTPSISGSGGPAYVEPVLTVTAPSGGIFSASPTPAGWSCALSAANTVLTCTSTTVTPIASGTALGAITTSVVFSLTPGPQTTSATLADAPDSATPDTNSVTTTTTAGPPALAVAVVGPPTAVAGSTKTIMVTPSITGAGGPAHSDPVMMVTAPSGGTFASAPTPPGLSCGLSVANTVLTCSSTDATPIASGTTLGAISASVTFSPTPGAQTTSATLSDTPDGAVPATHSAITTTTAPTPPNPPSRFGYRLSAGDGGVFAFGQDSFLGSLVSRNVTPTAPISGMAATSDGNGYWLVGVDGNIYTFGTAQNYGSLYAAHVPLNRPIVGMAATPDGKGYWLVASDGGVFAVGDAGFYGNTYTLGIENQLDKPVVGMVGDSTGHGYWLVASDGGVFTFGDAGFYGNTYTIGIENQLDKPMVGMAAIPDGRGYWLVAADGGVFAFGEAGFYGNTYTTGIENQLDKPMVGMAAMPDGGGYWLVAADGGVFAYGDAPFEGNTYTIGIENLLIAPMVALTEAP